MTIVSIHEYDLAGDVSPEAFEGAVRDADSRGLFDFPGLVDYQFLRGIEGDRAGSYAAVWTYESRGAWEALWGPPGDPAPPAEYPERWREWEALVDPLLASDADDIGFTSYESL